MALFQSLGVVERPTYRRLARSTASLLILFAGLLIVSTLTPQRRLRHYNALVQYACRPGGLLAVNLECCVLLQR